MKIKLPKTKKFIYILPVSFWILLSIVEIFSYFFQYPKPMYFRAWEYVSNEGLDSYYVPFKPLITWAGRREGDFLNLFRFTAKKEDTTYQKFSADEYGFRNRKGLLDRKIDAVIIGTSFVGGAAETQKNLVSEILTDKYQIKTYNYAGGSIQHFFEDPRFIKNPPKYFIVSGSENEMHQYHWILLLQDSQGTKIEIKKWNSTKEWSDQNDKFVYSWDNIMKKTKRFSIVKYELYKNYNIILNSIFPRSIVSDLVDSTAYYDKESDFIFYDPKGNNPTYTKEKAESLRQTIKVLNETKDVLKARNITLILAAMPGKEDLYEREYRSLRLENRTIVHLEEELKKNNIEHIELFDIMNKYAKENKDTVYFKDDGHWKSFVNQIIAEKLASKIKELELNK